MREGRELQNGVTERPSASAPGGRGGDGAHPPVRVRPYPQPVASALAPELNFKMPIGGSLEEREGGEERESHINQKRKNEEGQESGRNFSPGADPPNGRLWRLIDVGFGCLNTKM